MSEEVKVNYVPPGQTPGKAVHEGQLEGEMAQAGVPLKGISTVRNRAGKVQHVIVHLKSEPNDFTKQKIQEALSAHKAAPQTEGEKAQERLQAMLKKRKSGKAITSKEKDDLLDILMGLYSGGRG